MKDTAIEVKVIRELHREVKSWRKVGELLALNPADCWRTAKEKRGVTPSVFVAVDFWLRCEESSEPDFIRVLRRKIVPWLQRREQSMR